MFITLFTFDIHIVFAVDLAEAQEYMIRQRNIMPITYNVRRLHELPLPQTRPQTNTCPETDISETSPDTVFNVLVEYVVEPNSTSGAVSGKDEHFLLISILVKTISSYLDD